MNELTINQAIAEITLAIGSDCLLEFPSNEALQTALDALYEKLNRRADGWIAELRSDVATFAIAMEKTLQKHDNRPGWENEPFDYLLDRLVDEYQELADVFKSKYTKSAAMAQDVCSELVDIANFCMMIYCNCQRGVEEWPLPAEPKKGENDG